VRILNHEAMKHTFTTHSIPLSAMVGVTPLTRAPRIGDLVAAEVKTLGKHTAIETREGVRENIFPDDQIIAAFGNRYATDQFEGYAPDGPVAICDLLSIGGVCGEVVSRHVAMSSPTKLRVLGLVCDRDGQVVNQRQFGLRPGRVDGGDEVIVVIGSSMNSGKTTVVGTLARALSRAGHRVAAAKLTGTAASKDARFFASSGARPVLDFTDAGYPSTYLLGIDDLLLMHHTLLTHLRASAPDYIIVEIADGIFQRETKLLIESPEFRASVDHVFFAANDSLSAVTGQMFAEKHNLPLHATAGRITMSPLATREAEQVTGLPCLSTQQILNGAALRLLESKPASRPDVEAAVHVLRVPGEPVPTRTNRRALANGVAAH
jgi:Mrp family chromosome partitioning ATPase